MFNFGSEIELNNNNNNNNNNNVRWGVGVGGQSGCERRIEVFVKIQKKKKIGGGVGGGAGGSVGGRAGGVRVDVNEELKFL